MPRTLPRILSPGEADRLVGALRTHRDRAMVLAMLLAGLRRCEVLGLRFCDVQVADRVQVQALPLAGSVRAARDGSSTGPRVAYRQARTPAMARDKDERLFMFPASPGCIVERAS